MLRSLCLLSIPALLLLFALVGLLDFAFAASFRDSALTSAAYWITHSAGRWGTPVLVMLTALIYTTSRPGWGAKLWVWFRTTAMVGVLLLVFVMVNEHLIKPWLALARPSHTYMLRTAGVPASVDSLYLLPSEQRALFYEDLLRRDTTHFVQHDARVLAHWVEETGYSFPSGHSFNAFLLASILTFALLQLPYRTVRQLAWVPLAWAVLVACSRVALGAHTAVDVSVGASMGVVVSHALLSIAAVRRWLAPVEA